MNASEIIKSIEAEQLKAEVPEFAVGDTVKVHAKIKEGKNHGNSKVWTSYNRNDYSI